LVLAGRAGGAGPKPGFLKKEKALFLPGFGGSRRAKGAFWGPKGGEGNCRVHRQCDPRLGGGGQPIGLGPLLGFGGGGGPPPTRTSVFAGGGYRIPFPKAGPAPAGVGAPRRKGGDPVLPTSRGNCRHSGGAGSVGAGRTSVQNPGTAAASTKKREEYNKYKRTRILQNKKGQRQKIPEKQDEQP